MWICPCLPGDLPQLFRATTRQARDTIHVASLGVLADTEKSFREFLALAKKRRCEIFSCEDNRSFKLNGNCENLVKWWKDARRNGVAKIGAKMSADKKKSDSKAKVALITDRWPLPSKEWATKVLLHEAGISLNTAKAHLGKRPIAQYNYQAKLKRKAKKEGLCMIVRRIDK